MSSSEMVDSDETTGNEDSSEAPDLKETLRNARESRGLTIEEIATELRIEARLLKALEEGRLDDLGAPVFAKGYLRQYGARLGLRYEDLLSQYYDIAERRDVDIRPSRSIRLRDERQITVWVLAALAIALLAVFLVAWWLDESTPDLVTSTPEPETSAPIATPPLPAEDVVVVTPAEEPVEQPAVDDAVGEPAPPDAVAPSPAVAEPPAEADAEPPADPIEIADAPPVPPLDPANALTVELLFVQDSWAEITDARGERLYYGLGAAGETAQFAGAAPIRFFLGNAEGVAVTIDGDEYAIPRTGRRGNLAQFSVNTGTD